ncbi:MAG: hypothetical protein Q8N99_07910 [Nanoarchaeota archaeon]|nr:hypothetical protein [Nanoarchaeota archaeon]
MSTVLEYKLKPELESNKPLSIDLRLTGRIDKRRILKEVIQRIEGEPALLVTNHKPLRKYYHDIALCLNVDKPSFPMVYGEFASPNNIGFIFKVYNKEIVDILDRIDAGEVDINYLRGMLEARKIERRLELGYETIRGILVPIREKGKIVNFHQVFA